MVTKNFVFVIDPQFLIAPRPNVEVVVTYEYFPTSKYVSVRRIDMPVLLMLNLSNEYEVRSKLFDEIEIAAQHNAETTFKINGTVPVEAVLNNPAYQTLKNFTNY